MREDEGYDETGSPHFHARVAAGFEQEVEGFGVADGMCRRPIDPLYAHEPAYLAGHRTGLRLPPHAKMP